MDSLCLELPVDVPELEIPRCYLSVIPSLAADTPVNRFRFHVLQERRSALVFPPAEASFSRLPPSGTYDLSNLARHPVPPARYLQSLKTYLNNSSNDTRLSLRSIHNPTNREELLPLWVLTVWHEVSLLIDSRNLWTQSHSWVERLQATQQEGEGTQLALSHFGVLGWSSRISLYGLQGMTNLSLAQLLSDNCVNDEAIDLMARFLSSNPTLPARILVLDLRLSNFLSTISSQDVLSRPSPPHIRKFENQLALANTLYFPSFHAKYNHWIAFRVDTLHSEVVYGAYSVGLVPSLNCNTLIADSMGNSVPKPEAFIKALLWWLSARSGKRFAFNGRKLAAGSQRDTTSCGFFAMNAISHGIFGTDLLIHTNVRKNRLAWFNDLCKVIIPQVISLLPSLKQTTTLIVCNIYRMIFRIVRCRAITIWTPHPLVAPVTSSIIPAPLQQKTTWESLQVHCRQLTTSARDCFRPIYHYPPTMLSAPHQFPPRRRFTTFSTCLESVCPVIQPPRRLAHVP